MYVMLRAILNLLPYRVQFRLKRVWRRRILQKKTSALKQRRAVARLEFGTVPLGVLLNEIKDLGINEGDVLFVQTSFNDLYTLEATPVELVDGLRKLIGPSGSLFMPAYTFPEETGDWVFDVNRTPTYTGVVNEVFRRSSGVIRSLHPRHSICGVGAAAADILNGHEKCGYADGVGSPFDKMRSYPNAKILTLGLPPGFNAFLHWIEDFEPLKLPFSVHETLPRSYRYLSHGGGVKTLLDYRLTNEMSRLVDFPRIASHFSTQAFRYKIYKSIALGVYRLDALANDLILLRDQGIIHYFRRGDS